ncbi:MAG: Fis family transcriptional regulator [SAR86 cluster bacterium]|uniref:Fis family transcriptional regulator n=1 Tax=SAR86 cluster bacterium TaxID=2030880 RepID=A0A2A5CBF8_9GAMM|nr:MAG: Fis family transcriptional regulator [SAR86 cluster bacterium]
MSETTLNNAESTIHTETRGKILLVEDDLALRKMLFNSLEMQNFDVTEADNRQSAIEALKANSEIGVVILDLGLPPMEHTTDEGLAIIRDIGTELLAVKIIVLTGQDEELSALDAIREGAFDFLSKPASFEDILLSVNRAFLFHNKEMVMSADGMTRLQVNTKTSDGLKAVREEAEEKLVRQVLKDTGFNVYQSAKKLGIKRESIYYFMKKFGITRDND